MFIYLLMFAKRNAGKIHKKIIKVVSCDWGCNVMGTGSE